MPTAPLERRREGCCHSAEYSECCVEGCEKRLICSKNMEKSVPNVIMTSTRSSHAKHFRKHSCFNSIKKNEKLTFFLLNDIQSKI